ncbi:MAG TPA: PEPxxWA-CTERM sorting domain-containing protein [Sphingomonas sp.]|nr:PEPxxWA-CTERM sorting domain-containing protein [Sphingomonas sp.]
MKISCSVAAVAAACSVTSVAQAATRTVYNAAQLDAAVKSAVAGDTIQVAPGNYGAFEFKNINPASAINIVSANSTNMPVFTSIRVSNSSNLKLTRLIASAPAPGSANPTVYAAIVSQSHDIRLSGMVFRGVLGGGVSNEPRGLRLSQSTNVTVAANSFTELSHAILTDGSSRLNISDNGFTGIRTDGIISDGATSSTIARNRFSDFRPQGADHPDAIQLFNGGAGTLNLTVTDNLIIGSKAGQMQGIFLQNGNGIRSQLDQVSVTNNLLWGTMYNGITASAANRVTVSGNRLYSNARLAIPKTWERLEQVNSVTSTSNYAGAYIFNQLGTLTRRGDVLSTADALALAAIANWDASHTAAGQSLIYRDPNVFATARSTSLAFRAPASIGITSLGGVPEPANWAMMIAGFGLIGAVRRRLQRRAGRRMARA